MSEVEIFRQDTFTVASNEVIQIVNMSNEARGLWIFLQSLPHNFTIHTKYLCQKMNIGIDKMRRIFKELKEFGLCETYTTKDSKTGRYNSLRYKIYSHVQKHLLQREIKKMFPEPDFPGLDNGDPGKTRPIKKKDSKKERYVKNTTTNTPRVEKSPISSPKPKVPKPPAPKVVVFSCLENLNLSQDMKEKVSRDFTEEEVKTAVKRTLLFKSRKSDPGSFLHFLYKPEKYQELVSKEEKAQKEHAELNQKIKNNKKIADEFFKKIEKMFTVTSYAYMRENALWFTKNEKSIALGFSEENFEELMLKYGNWLKS